MRKRMIILTLCSLSVISSLWAQGEIGKGIRLFRLSLHERAFLCTRYFDYDK